jgi:restriction endonuclease-like protein/putative AbiEi antitoxin of type IV toxin-antitoxin system
METPDTLCARIAATQHGVISLPQARAAGLGANDIAYRVAQGRLERELPRVLGFPGAPRGWDRSLMAALLWAGEGAAASHRAAARKWGFDGFSNSPVEISSTNHRGCWRLRLAGGEPVIVHRVDGHLAPEIVCVGHHPVTSPRRTILDLAGRRHHRTESILDAALRRELTTVGQLWLLLEQEWMRGRRGVRILRDLLVDRTEGRAPSDSDLELRFRTLVDRAGLPPPVHQYPVELPGGVVHLDLAYPEAMLAIEVDSYTWHMDRKAFERDRRRDNELRALGWTVFRFTWAMIRFEPERVIDLVRGHLLRRLSSTYE